TCEIEDKDAKIQVLLGDVNPQFPAKSRQYIFVNNRPIYNRNISYTVNSVYEDIFPRDVYPVFTVIIHLPSEDVDVNVHPAKREVRLKDEGYILSAIAELCRGSLSGQARVKEVSDKSAYSERLGYIKETTGSSVILEGAGRQELFGEEGSVKFSKEDLRTKLKNAFYTGCYKNKYLFFDAGNTLLVMDQHAAHERIRFESLKRQWESGKIDIQRLLTPLIIKIGPEEMSVWEEGSALLETLGFLTTRWDNSSIALHGFPHGIKNPEVSIRNLLDGGHIRGYDRETLARKACKGAVSAGDKITEEEAVHLKNELLKCDTPFVCPHGRPTVVEFSELFFDRQFLR
ncbi:MAG: hypothetical protein PHR42_04310, partial [Caldisericia bacterium]|nr:hypothetical protein [Caldisericia bacterium]